MSFGDIWNGWGFVGYYTVDGPNGFVEADNQEEAKKNAEIIVKDWPRAKHGEVYVQKKKKTWMVTIWTE